MKVHFYKDTYTLIDFASNKRFSMKITSNIYVNQLTQNYIEFLTFFQINIYVNQLTQNYIGFLTFFQITT